MISPSIWDADMPNPRLLMTNVFLTTIRAMSIVPVFFKDKRERPPVSSERFSIAKQ